MFLLKQQLIVVQLFQCTAVRVCNCAAQSLWNAHIRTNARLNFVRFQMCIARKRLTDSLDSIYTTLFIVKLLKLNLLVHTAQICVVKIPNIVRGNFKTEHSQVHSQRTLKLHVSKMKQSIRVWRFSRSFCINRVS